MSQCFSVSTVLRFFDLLLATHGVVGHLLPLLPLLLDNLLSLPVVVGRSQRGLVLLLLLRSCCG